MASLFGCGGEAAPVRNYAEVTGKVTYEGAPLKMGQVTFQPASGAYVRSDIKADGTYSLQGVIGKNTVMVVSRDADTSTAAPTEKKPIVMPTNQIPDKYGVATSPLQTEVEAGENTYDIVLTK